MRGIGFGATKTKIAVKTHYKKIIKECRDSMKEVNERLAMLEVRTYSFMHIFFFFVDDDE